MGMQVQPTSTKPLKLYAAFSGGALDLLDTDPDIMGRSLERIPLLYEGDITPDRPGDGGGKWDGVSRLLAWDWGTTVESVRRVVPDPDYAGWIVVNFETFEQSLNPTTLAAMKDIVATISNERPRAKVGWYGHPRRFFWQHLTNDKTGEIDRYMEQFATMSWLDALAPHQYPVGEVVASRDSQRKTPKSVLAEDATLAIKRQANLVEIMAGVWEEGKFKRRRPVVWFVTPMKQEGDDSTAGCWDAAQFDWWIKSMRAAGVTDLAIWMHCTPGRADQKERVRKALEMVFEVCGV